MQITLALTSLRILAGNCAKAFVGQARSECLASQPTHDCKQHTTSTLCTMLFNIGLVHAMAVFGFQAGVFATANMPAEAHACAVYDSQT